MTTDLTHPENVLKNSAFVNTSMPTREEVAKAISGSGVTSPRSLRQADAVIALFAPALAAAHANGMREAAGIASAYAVKSDGKFTGVVRRARHGEKNLELAAATAAGMDHAGRNIAAAILAAIPK